MPWWSRSTLARSLPSPRCQVCFVRPLHDYKLDLSQTVPHRGDRRSELGVDGWRQGRRGLWNDYTRFSAAPERPPPPPHTEPQRLTRRRSTVCFQPARRRRLRFRRRVSRMGRSRRTPTRLIATERDRRACAGGHGTHVRYHRRQRRRPHRGLHRARLYAVKVCSSVSTACSGLACCRAWSSSSIQATATFPMRST
jgi:hypothetical protein